LKNVFPLWPLHERLHNLAFCEWGFVILKLGLWIYRYTFLARWKKIFMSNCQWIGLAH
jgi:hypothetical protein